ncbi:hypothetical protein SNEBB_007940 [Seison nebaliae]|nr:hypothetical protein SNEBB_007940 [Seison nebaliae]
MSNETNMLMPENIRIGHRPNDSDFDTKTKLNDFMQIPEHLTYGESEMNRLSFDMEEEKTENSRNDSTNSLESNKNVKFVEVKVPGENRPIEKEIDEKTKELQKSIRELSIRVRRMEKEMKKKDKRDFFIFVSFCAIVVYRLFNIKR